MISKLHKGADPGRLLSYLYDTEHSATERHENPRMIAGTLISWDEPRAVAVELRELARENPAVGKPVFHASLRVSEQDAGRLDDEGWGQAAERYAQQMGFGGSGWVAIRHAADHVHVVASRVDLDGQRVDDSHDYARSMRACRAIEAQHGLESVDEHKPKRTSTLTRGERAMAERQRQEGATQARGEPPRVQLRAIMENARDRASSREDFEGRCQRQGVTLKANEASTGKMNGYSATLAGWQDKDGEQVWLAASKVHKELSWARLGPALERDREAERDQEQER